MVLKEIDGEARIASVAELGTPRQDDLAGQRDLARPTLTLARRSLKKR